MDYEQIKGCIPALVTPMKYDNADSMGNYKDPSINYKAFGELIEYVVTGAVSGIAVAGCTGCASSLRPKEQIQLVKYAKDVLNKRGLLIAGDGSNSTTEAIALAQRINDIGVDYHLMISPYQNKPMQEGLYQHYKTIAEALPDSKIIVYNVPGRTGRNVEAETTIRLAQDYKNIVAVKEASGNMEQIKYIIDKTKDLDHFSVLSGDDGLTLDIIKAGGTGCISVAANISPGRTSGLIDAALYGNYDVAESLNDSLKPLYEALFMEVNPQPCHAALRMMGIDVGVPRLPMINVEEKTLMTLDRVLVDLELIGR